VREAAEMRGKRVEPAEPAPRMVARLIDTLVVGLPVVLVARATLPRTTAEAVTSVGLAAAIIVYDTVQHGLWGRTLGKRVTGVQVVAARDGAPPGFAVALLRATVYAAPIALRPVPVLGLLAGIVWVAGVALVLRAPERQALHDRATGTAVVTFPAFRPVQRQLIS
jgi:uncharacterized RDD family membrane protein YckC